MTVQELIDILNKIENKNSTVELHIETGRSMSICSEFGVGDDEDVVWLSGEETDYS